MTAKHNKIMLAMATVGIAFIAIKPLIIRFHSSFGMLPKVFQLGGIMSQNASP